MIAETINPTFSIAHIIKEANEMNTVHTYAYHVENYDGEWYFCGSAEACSYDHAVQLGKLTPHFKVYDMTTCEYVLEV